jgi:hypothetical protein
MMYLPAAHNLKCTRCRIIFVKRDGHSSVSANQAEDVEDGSSGGNIAILAVFFILLIIGPM